MKVDVDQARALAENVLVRGGMPGDEAVIIADVLLEAELRGRRSHGFIRLPDVAARYSPPQHGGIRVVREHGHWALLDGDRQSGYLVAHRAMTVAIERARTHGTAVVGVHNSTHCGMAGAYVDMALRQDLVALMFVDCFPRVTAFGGTEPVLGTNPLAVGIPSATVPVLLDMSVGSITNGDLLVAMADGRRIAENLAFDPNGNPTTDPRRALQGSVRPFGGHRGFGLALVIQVLAGALVGAATIPPAGSDYGLLIIVIDPSIFVPIDAFKQAVDDLAGQLKTSRREFGVDDILIPGERAYRERGERLTTGIDLDDDLYERLAALV